jgi:ribosome-associated protein
MPSTSPSPTIADLVQRAARACADNRADRVMILDLRGVSDMTDYFVIASGTSDTHVRALGNHVVDDLAAVGQRPEHEEGLEKGRWVLLDYVDFVDHVFHPSLREFYQIERLWGDAAVVPVRAARAGA